MGDRRSISVEAYAGTGSQENVREIQIGSGLSSSSMRILITDGNERSSLAATRALGQRGLEVIVGAETVRSLAGASRYCRESFVYPSPYADAGKWVASLLQEIKRFHVGMVFPMSDMTAQLIGENRQEFEKYCTVPMPPLASFEFLSDKVRLMQLAGLLGIPIPETIFVADGRIEGHLHHIQDYPVVVKPGRSVMKIDGKWRKTSVHYAADPSELGRLYREVDYLRYPSLLQRHIDGEGQGLFALCDHGQPIALFAHRRIREKPPSGGVSVFRESIGLPKLLTDYGVRLLRHAGWHGVAMVEFKVERKSEVPVLMEVNGRFWGSLQLAVDAGVNFPFLLYRMASGEKLEASSNGYRVGVKSRWLLGDVDHLLLRLFKPESALRLPPGSPSRLQTLVSFSRFFARDLHYEVLSLRDFKPFLYELSRYFSAN